MYRLFCLLAVVLPVLCFAQDTEPVDLDTFILELNAQCPIHDGENWALNAFSSRGDTVQVELLVPTNLSMFLTMLTTSNDNVRHLWIRQLSHYGELWDRFVELLAATDRTLSLIIRPRDTEGVRTITFPPGFPYLGKGD